MEALKTPSKANGKRVTRRSQHVYLNTITDIVVFTQYRSPPIRVRQKSNKRVKSLGALKGKGVTGTGEEGVAGGEETLVRRASKLAAEIRNSLTPQLVPRPSKTHSRLRPRSVALAKSLAPVSPSTLPHPDNSPRQLDLSPPSMSPLTPLKNKRKSALDRLLISSALLSPVLKLRTEVKPR